MRTLSKLTWLLFLSFFSYGFTVFAIGPCQTSIQETYQVSRHIFGLIFPAFAACFVLASILGGFAGERWGKKTVLMTGMALYGISLIAFAAWSSFFDRPIFAIAVILMAINGGASGAVELTVSALAADINPTRKGTVLNAMQVAFGIGAITSPMIVASLVAENQPWQLIYYGGGLLTLVVWLLLTLEHTPRNHSHDEPISRQGMRILVKSPVVWALTLAMVLYVGAEVSFGDWQSNYLETGLGASRQLASAVPSIFWLAMTLARIPVSAMAHRWSARKSLVTMGFGGAVAVLLAASAGHFPEPLQIPAAIAGVFAAGLFFAGGFGMVLTYATDRFGLHTGPVFSFMIAGVGVGSGLFPAMVGFAADHWSIAGAMLIPALLIFMLGLLFTMIHRLPNKEWEAYTTVHASERI